MNFNLIEAFSLFFLIVAVLFVLLFNIFLLHKFIVGTSFPLFIGIEDNQWNRFLYFFSAKIEKKKKSEKLLSQNFCCTACKKMGSVVFIKATARSGVIALLGLFKWLQYEEVYCNFCGKRLFFVAFKLKE